MRAPNPHSRPFHVHRNSNSAFRRWAAFALAIVVIGGVGYAVRVPRPAGASTGRPVAGVDSSLVGSWHARYTEGDRTGELSMHVSSTGDIKIQYVMQNGNVVEVVATLGAANGRLLVTTVHGDQEEGTYRLAGDGTLEWNSGGSRIDLRRIESEGVEPSLVGQWRLVSSTSERSLAKCTLSISADGGYFAKWGDDDSGGIHLATVTALGEQWDTTSGERGKYKLLGESLLHWEDWRMGGPGTYERLSTQPVAAPALPAIKRRIDPRLLGFWTHEETKTPDDLEFHHQHPAGLTARFEQDGPVAYRTIGCMPTDWSYPTHAEAGRWTQRRRIDEIVTGRYELRGENVLVWFEGNRPPVEFQRTEERGPSFPWTIDNEGKPVEGIAPELVGTWEGPFVRGQGRVTLKMTPDGRYEWILNFPDLPSRWAHRRATTGKMHAGDNWFIRTDPYDPRQNEYGFYKLVGADTLSFDARINRSYSLTLRRTATDP